MKVRVAYTVEIGDDYRMALSHAWGNCGVLVTREEVKSALRLTGSNNDDDLMQEWQDCEVCQAASR